ncbi:MAG: hypothetical protein Q8N23_18495 [Archangium sp.]|nr:hypothetical protein [Archangium sp.]MDP3154675.1 hypothetical protein [Archangium sp.]MDP3572697.1 hypothetical protein [Archangium sp.]
MSSFDDPPIGSWVRISVMEFGPVIAFVYLDAQAGLSAKGGVEGKMETGMTVRYPVGAPWIALDAAECKRLELPAIPPWLHHYGLPVCSSSSLVMTPIDEGPPTDSSTAIGSGHDGRDAVGGRR